jgi:putative endonuclease
MHGIEKRIVDILRSEVDPSRHYVGITNDVPARLEWHNHGPSGHTVEHRPWSLVVSMEFPTQREAVRFEKYLKSGSVCLDGFDWDVDAAGKELRPSTTYGSVEPYPPIV